MAQFKRGGKKPPNSGRRAGTPNRSTREIKEIARELLDETYFQVLRLRLLNGKCAPQIETLVHHFAWGKPKDRVEIENSGKITVEQLRALRDAYRRTRDDGDTDDDEPLPP